ncbi:hemolysin family protein [Halobaculum sp. CBA1158]|uniref:CNNM domain-containing protein n=1 Tax=Halobaculum sp. CBA1158 TaxID=2904243 RepID=UPI001F29420A|nr:hemolysin family protein [Halobaculum sp. CBA1158]UIP01261.1 hemolysin family protein [Halobaculum sp. CBA1158]
MGTPEVLLRLVAGVGLILANGFFVAIEFALTRARQFTEEEFIGDNPSLERAWEMTQNLEIYLTTCQVGITASSIAVGIVAEPALAALFAPLFENTALASVGAGAIIAFAIINLLHLTHGEQTPTYLGVERSRLVSRYGATPLYYFHALISPLITFGDWIAKGTLKLFGIEMTGAWLETEEDVIESRADLRRRLSSTLEEGDLAAERRKEIVNALRVGQRTVSDIMVPPEEIVSLSTANAPAENLAAMRDHPHTRFPLLGDDGEEFLGIVYVPALIREVDRLDDPDLDLREIAAPPMTLSPETTVSDAVDRFQMEGQELALVVSDGEIRGLVTATDAFEEVMGELEDPMDRRAAEREVGE